MDAGLVHARTDIPYCQQNHAKDAPLWPFSLLRSRSPSGALLLLHVCRLWSMMKSCRGAANACSIYTSTWRLETQEWLAGVAASHQACTWRQALLVCYPAQCSVARYLLGHKGGTLCFRGNCESGSASFPSTCQSQKAEACLCPAQNPQH